MNVVSYNKRKESKKNHKMYLIDYICTISSINLNNIIVLSIICELCR